jgi:transcriptional regulator with XRE-family HTH domain
MERFARAVGEELRDARRHAGLTLRQALDRSEGRFKPSVIGGYERGERSISLARFCELSAFYGIPADRLLARVLARMEPSARRPTVLDLGRLERMDNDVGGAINGFVREVKRDRGDPTQDIITLRSGDLEQVALASGIELEQLLRALKPAQDGS